MSHVFLIGFMGAGKSTVGRLAAQRLGVAFVDLDAVIEEELGRSIAEIFEDMGELAFRTAESAALAALADVPSAVVACGGGVVVDDGNRRILRELGDVVYLRVEAEEAIARIGDISGRPLLASGDTVAMANTLLSARETLYRAAADTVIDTSGHDVTTVADAVIHYACSLRERGATSE